jgi:hypothetical protein
MTDVYEPKSRKQAQQMMALHTGMGDTIEIIEEDNFDQAE